MYLMNNQPPAPMYHILEAPLLNMHLIEFIALIVPGPMEDEMYCKPNTIPNSASGMS
jgi:hypothetical protein